MIKSLTPEQEALITVYCEKWRKIAFSTDTINFDKAASVVFTLYERLGLKKPKVIFFESPKLVCDEWEERWKTENTLINLNIRIKWHPLYPYYASYIFMKFVHNILKKLFKLDIFQNQLEIYEGQVSVLNCLHSCFQDQIDSKFYEYLWNQIHYSVVDTFAIEAYIAEEIWYDFYTFNRTIRPDSMRYDAALFDFCISILGCKYPEIEWNIIKDLFEFCGWIYPMEDICCLSNRPSIVSLDRDRLLHAEGQPAIQYRDGSGLYYSHGDVLPEEIS
ncbi:MAG: hypothetical protein AAGA60_26795 [Cyanobacteria bacterium P01_E01_bin.42]